MSTSRNQNVEALCLVAALVIAALAISLRLTVPQELTEYVTNGFLLPTYRYGLLVPLIVYGVILSSERARAVAINFAVFASAVWISLRFAETIIYGLDEQLTLIFVDYPSIATLMALVTGGAFFLAQSTRGWVLPILSGIIGLGLGFTVVIESPANLLSDWFASAGALGGAAIIIAALTLAGGLQQLVAAHWLTIGGRIVGSWLIAASLMLTALAVVSKRQPAPDADPSAILQGLEFSQEQ